MQTVPQYTEYQVMIGSGLVQLEKITNSSTSPNNQLHTTLAQQPLPGTFDPKHWYQIEVSAVANQFLISLDGKQLIQYKDSANPILSGMFTFLAYGCCETDFGNILVRSLSDKPPGIVNAASFATGPVAPGEIVALFGNHMGPQGLVIADGSNGYPTSLAGTQVLFNGIPAPLIYTSAGQVSAIVPWALDRNAPATLTVKFPGAAIPSATVALAGSAPALFTASGGGFGPGAILNQDYSLNSLLNPAKAGSVVILYGTGGGVLQSPQIDGALTTAAAQVTANVSVLVGGKQAKVLYAGAAPQLVNGAIQINVQLSDGITGLAVPVLATFGQYVSQSGVSVAIQ